MSTSTKPPQGDAAAARRRGARPLADIIGAALAPACRKRGFTTVDLVAHWPDIIGGVYAGTTQPDKLAWPRLPKGVESETSEPATLTLRCAPSVALRLQHELPVVMERINMFFGWKAVGRIKLLQTPLRRPAPHARPRPGPLLPADAARVTATCAPIADDDLRAAVERLGRAVAQRTGR